MATDLARIAMLCEGDAESYDKAFSGSAKSLLDNLRQLGHSVHTVDTGLYGWRRLMIAAGTYAPNRAVWRSRFQLGRQAFFGRSRQADRKYRQRVGVADVVLQIGATSQPPDSAPYALYCDWNMALTMREAASGSSVAAALPAEEAKEINEREAQIYRSAAVIFTVSERLRKSFIEDYGLPADKVCTVYAGTNIDASFGPEAAAERATLPPTILFVAKLFQNKGGDTLLEAFQQVRQSVPDARLIIVGPLGLSLTDPGVAVLGLLRRSVPEENERLITAYRSANVFCLPTRYDAFPGVVREAMFFRLPCVTSDIWAMSEMVVEDVTGYTVPVGDAQALADRLITLLRHPSRAIEMGNAGRRLVEERFTWPAVARRVHERLQLIAGKRP